MKHFTQWGELAPASQESLRALETRIVETREDSKLLDGVARLREGPNGAGAKRRAELERSVSRASDTLKLLETQLWSDNDRLQGLRDAVVSTLRDAEHAQARLQRLKDASAADEAAAATHARLHPGQPPARRRARLPPRADASESVPRRRGGSSVRHRRGVRARHAGDGT